MTSTLARVWFPVCLTAVLLLTLPVLVLVVMHLAGADADVNRWLGENFSLSYEFPLPWAAGIVMLLIPPAIILLYFLKLKRKPLQVPSTFLWRKSIEDLHVNSLFQWLRENVLLLLQLLAVLFMLYALMGFRFHGSTQRGRHYILIVDNSASMSATDVEPTRLGWAKQQALKVIDAATEDSFGMVIVFNSKATTLQGYTSNRAKLREAVTTIEQSHRSTRIEDALTLADSLANQIRSTEDVASQPAVVDPKQERTFVQPKGVPTDVYLFSDGGFPDPSESAVAKLNSMLAGNASALGNINMHFELAGQRGADKVNNVGIVGFSALRLPEDRGAKGGKDALRLQVLVQLRNFSPKPQSVTLRLDATADGQPVDTVEHKVELPARVAQRGDPDKNIPEIDEPGEANVPLLLKPMDQRGSTVLRAYLHDNKDDYALDDESWLVVGLTRKARVLIVGPKNPVLDAFFDQEAAKKLARVERMDADELKGKYREAARGGEFDLVIFDRCAPESEEDMPQSNTMFLDRPPPPWERGSKALKNPVLMVSKKDSPLMRHLAQLWDTGVSEGFRFHPVENLSEAGRKLFSTGEKEKKEAGRALPPLTRLVEAGGELPVVFTLPRGSYTDLVLTFPLVNDRGDLATNWPLQPSFPLFLRNVVLVLGNVAEGARETAVPPGEPMVLRPEAGVQGLEVTPPGGKPERLTRGNRPDFIYGGTDRVGVYQVKRDDGAVYQFAVTLLDPLESSIEPRERFRVGSDTVAAGKERSQPRDLWKWLVAAALGLLMVEWYVYNRRVGV